MDLITEVTSAIKPRHQANPLRYDKKFIDICRSIPYSPKYQYQLLQMIIQVEEKIMEEASKEGLNTSKIIMITHSKLRAHPNLQM